MIGRVAGAALALALGSGASSSVGASTEGYLGLVIGGEAEEVIAEASGLVEEIRREPGDRIEQGDILVALDRPDLRLEVDAAAAALESARARKEEAELASEDLRRSLDRYRVVDGLVSAEELVDLAARVRKAEIGARAASARVRERAAKLAVAQHALGASLIRARTSGFLTACFVRVGDVVSAGDAAARVVDPDDLRVRFAVPRAQASAYSAGTRVRIRLEEGALLDGEVIHMSPSGDVALPLALLEARILPGGTPRAGSGDVVRVHRVGAPAADHDD